MPRGELSLAEFEGAQQLSDALPEGLDFGNDFEESDGDDKPTVADLPDGDSDAADVAGDGGDPAEPDVDEADDADDGPEGDDAPEPEADDPEPTPPAKEKGKEPKIPKSRLDQSIRKQRLAEQRTQELEAELAELRRTTAEAARPKPLTADEIKTKMAEANDALLAGDTDKAATLQAELFSALAPAPAPVEAPPAPVDLAAQVEERLEFKAVIKELYARFPELDENHELFNAELGTESVELQAGYLRRGFTMAEATRKAAEAVAKLNDLEDRQAEPAPPPSRDKAVQAAKTKEKVAKATKAPPPLAGKTSGEGSDKININELSDDEFMALPETVRNKLLGITL